MPDDSTDLKVDKTVTFQIAVAQPPGYTANIWIRDFINGKVANRQPYPIQNSTVTAKKTFSETGEHGLIVIGELRNQSNNIISRDSIVKVVNIIPAN